MSNWHDRNDRPLDIGDTVTYLRNRTTFDETYESSKVIGFTSTENVIVRGDLIHDDEVVSPSDCMKWE